MALLAFILVLLGLGRMVARAGPKISLTNTPVATPLSTPPPTETPAPTETPSLTETPAPTQAPKPTSVPVPTAIWGDHWATPAPSRWKRYLPCADDYLDVYRKYAYLDEVKAEEYVAALEISVTRWLYWFEYWYERETHEIPFEIGLAVMMAESRGSTSAVSCSNAIGLMGVVPSDVVRRPPEGCKYSRPLTFEGHPTTKYLSRSKNNIRFGLDHLEYVTWEGQAYFDGFDVPPYRDKLYKILPEAVDLSWWYGPAGQYTLAMYQCGQAGFRRGNCGKYGGPMYAEDILHCWVPWVQEIIDPEVSDGGAKNVPVLSE